MSVTRITCKRELVILGAGGFGAEAAWVAEDMNAVAMTHGRTAAWDIIGYMDNDSGKRGTWHAGRIVHGAIEEVGRNFEGRGLWFFCAIGDNAARARMARLAEGFGWRPTTLVHPSAIVASNAEIGPGSYIGPASVISVNAKVGAHVIIDMHVSVGHDAVLSDFCEVFPGARVSGGCRVGEFALVGSNATLLPGTLVADRAVVGANSVAQGCVQPDTTILGVPARIIFRKTN
jgi:sugar O-acyltransferase (sialic acid O-acetyltransferase NeuD family)